jgi:hypothetical protein
MKAPEALRPALSAAVHLTSVAPIGKRDPEALEQLTLRVPSPPVALT